MSATSQLKAVRTDMHQTAPTVEGADAAFIARVQDGAYGELAREVALELLWEIEDWPVADDATTVADRLVENTHERELKLAEAS